MTAVAAALHWGPVAGGLASMDRRFDYAQAVVLAGLALVLAAAWTVWRRPDASVAARERAALHLLLRWSLAAVLFGYGWIKVFPVQFLYPSLVRMMEPVGTLPLPTLLLTTLGASPPFRVVIGLVEVVAAVLLLPRAWRLGAPVALASCLFIALLNLTYDITDKLFTLHLVVMAAIVAAPDLAGIARWLISGRPPAVPSPFVAVVPNPGGRRALVRWSSSGPPT